jgi:hypothetical protein
MTPFFYPARNNWRVQIPASETETGKRTSRLFPTKEEAEEFIQEHYKAGSVQLAELSLHEKHVLGVIRQSSDYTPDLLLDAWRDYGPDSEPRVISRSLSFAKLLCPPGKREAFRPDFK